MAKTRRRSPEFDAYIEQAAPFARPILKRLRKLYHQACPEIEETIKWQFPHFEYKGIVGSMAAFKHYVSFGFWKAKLMKDPHHLLTAVGNTSMGGTKVSHIDELPPDDVILSYIIEAIALNEAGTTVPRPKRSAVSKELPIPADLQAALRKSQPASATFERLSPSHRKEYIEWINEAKREATRLKRLATTVEWLAEGKSQNWKYIK